MDNRNLIASVRQDESNPEMLLVTSPLVGMADGAPRKGIFLNALDRILTVRVMGERYSIRMPLEVQGRVIKTFFPNSMTPLGFGDPLVLIDPRAVGQEATAAVGTEAGQTEGSEGGAILVSSPTDGIFYRKPSPDSEPYVEVGSAITTGAVLGLVEVMKCFNQITYGGVGLPVKGTIVKILADDSMEVQYGQPLFSVKPMEAER